MQTIRVFGSWDEGFVLDKYVAHSEYVGEDAFGHPQFNNTYTELGRLLHMMKYNGHVDTSQEIAELASEFVLNWLSDKNIDTIIPVPPTVVRDTQPVFLICAAISELLGKPYTTDVLSKTSVVQAKNLSREYKDLSGTIKKLLAAKRPCNILLVDDIYSTGQTANACVSVLKTDPLINNIYYLGIAKTK